MLSKKEIEKDKKVLRNISECFTYSMWSEDTEALRRILKYIDQLEKTISRKMSNNKRLSKKYLKERYKNKKLESDKQKIIEKLEEDIKKNNEFEFMPLQIEKAYNNYYKLGKIDEAQEILKILKGENDE